MGIVDHRHEKIGGGDDAGLVVHLPDGRIVGRFAADQQQCKGLHCRLPRQQGLQHGGRQLAATAAAMGKFGEARGRVHGIS